MPDRSANASSGDKSKSLIETAKESIEDARHFFSEELWDEDTAALPRMKRFFFSCCRVSVIVVQGFVSDNCGLQSSALTYISLMSMIPVLAMMFSFSKGIGMQNNVIETIGLEKVEVTVEKDGETQTETKFRVAASQENEDSPPHEGFQVQPAERRGFSVAKLPEPMQRVVTTVLSYVENTQFGTLGLVGSLVVFWAAMKAMSKLEQSFNTIWGISASRPLFRKLAEYFFVLVLVPVLFLTATSLNAALSSPKLLDLLAAWVGPLAGLYSRSLRLFGVGVVIGAFTFLYKYMPNTRVKLFPAVAGGLVGGILWYITQYVYITFQVGITRYNAIYGTFAAVPFFLAWLFINWMIVLFGAEVSFAVQNHRTYMLEGAAESASPAAKILLGMVLTYETCRAHLNGDGPWCPAQWGRENAIPARLIASVSETLEEKHILVAVADEEEKEPSYVPAKALDRLTLGHVEQAFRDTPQPYTDRLLPMIPEKAADAFTTHHKQFMDKLSTVCFRDLIEE